MTFPITDHKDLGPPPGPFRFRTGGARRLPRGLPWVVVVIVTLIVLYTVLSAFKSIYADLLWFDSVDYRSVYVKRIWTSAWLFVAGGAVFLVIFIPNVVLARRLAPATDDPDAQMAFEFPELAEALRSAMAQHVITIVMIFVAVLIALIFALSTGGRWEEFLLFRHGGTFGMKDPQFQRDLGFYVFKLPIYEFIVNWLAGALLVTIVAVIAVYVLRIVLFGFRFDGSRTIPQELLRIAVPRSIKLHVSALVAMVLITFIARYYLQTFALVYSSRGAELGAFYTDIHASLPALYGLMATAAITTALVVVGAFRKGLVLPVTGVALWIVVGVVGGQVIPALMQSFLVQPDEATRERQYLQRNIDVTRWAYGLDQIEERQFPAALAATAGEAAANDDSISNVRLWDPEPLRSALQQLQTIRPLFEFVDVDVDRYVFNGKYRQVMLSARELNSRRLPADAQTWVNSRLQFTHGYGYAVASVTQFEPDGTPRLLVSDIPMQGAPLTDRPEIYFGEQPDHYIIVGGESPEFTPLGGGENVETRFEGSGGVRLNSLFRRIVYAWEKRDRNILISGAVNDESRIVYRRNIQERISEIAPFLRLDADPYLVVDPSGLYWMQDAYTTTNRIPYSHRADGINYIRNSVKVVVNAYSGETNLYAVEPDEPLLKAYAAVFPDLFKSFAEMPEGIRAHIRYPEDLFRLQAEQYLRYHIEDALDFYQREDQWDVPTEIFGSVEQQVRPYYVIARLPGSTSEEFMLILPFVPRSRTNAIAWLAARSDGSDYGKLVAFRFPSSTSVPGPTQVERRIDADGRVSQQLTLWNQSGSTVIRGNLLMIPIGNSNMFFEPLHLAAAGGSNTIPQLKRVVVVNGDSIAMEPTLSRALDVIFGRAQPSGLDSSGAAPPISSDTVTAEATASGTTLPGTVGPATPGAATPEPVGGDVATLVDQARRSYDLAQRLLRDGDFAGYGQEIARLEEILDRLQELTGTPVAPP